MRRRSPLWLLLLAVALTLAVADGRWHSALLLAMRLA
jgi:hypothetical protein